jgi:hypothetical protein
LDWIFQPRSLKSSIVGYFGFDDERTWKSFVGGKAGIDRPTPRMRELWVRPTWRARQIAEGFPEFRSGPVVTPAMAANRLAKTPQGKAATRRARHAENAERFRREAEQRRALREEG